jgi:NTE family protein
MDDTRPPGSHGAPAVDRSGEDDLATALIELFPDTRPAFGARKLALALQGGGSFGAFTWGVLDRLLEEEGIGFETVSGSSAGAVNAVALAEGLRRGGRPGARKTLARVWDRIGKLGNHAAAIPSALGLMTGMISPATLNPFDLSPLRRILESEIDFEALRAAAPVGLMIAATRVSDGLPRLFGAREISLDAVMASACLPKLNRPVTIDGEDYWDGGLSTNPPLLPLVAETTARDVLLVRVTPSRAERSPSTAADIERRLARMTFSSTLETELTALELLRSTARSGLFASPFERRLSSMTLHRIVAEDEIDDLATESMLNPKRAHLRRLFEHGRVAAGHWLGDLAAEAG